MSRWLLLCLLAAACKQAPQADEAVPRTGESIARPMPSDDIEVSAPEAVDDSFEGVPHRRLTGAERALLAPLFKGSIDVAAVRVIDGKYIVFQPADTYMTPDGNIYAPGALFEADFTAPSVRLGRRSTFVHEMTHVWQHTSGMDLVMNGIAEFFSSSGDYGSVYQYSLAKGMDLLDYGFEQQASIVQDYFLIGQGYSPTHLANPGASPNATRAMYDAVLAKFLADPGYAKSMSPEALAKKQSAARDRMRAAAKAAAERGDLPEEHSSCGCAWHEAWNADAP